MKFEIINSKYPLSVHLAPFNLCYPYRTITISVYPSISAVFRRMVGVLCSALSTPSLFFACLSASVCSPASVFIPPACDAGILIVGNC